MRSLSTATGTGLALVSQAFAEQGADRGAPPAQQAVGPRLTSTLQSNPPRPTHARRPPPFDVPAQPLLRADRENRGGPAYRTPLYRSSRGTSRVASATSVVMLVAEPLAIEEPQHAGLVAGETRRQAVAARTGAAGCTRGVLGQQVGVAVAVRLEPVASLPGGVRAARPAPSAAAGPAPQTASCNGARPPAPSASRPRSAPTGPAPRACSDRLDPRSSDRRAAQAPDAPSVAAAVRPDRRTRPAARLDHRCGAHRRRRTAPPGPGWPRTAARRGGTRRRARRSRPRPALAPPAGTTPTAAGRPPRHTAVPAHGRLAVAGSPAWRPAAGARRSVR